MWALKLAPLTEKDDIESYLVTFMVAHKIDKGIRPPLFSPTAKRKGAISICSATPDGSCNLRCHQVGNFGLLQTSMRF